MTALALMAIAAVAEPSVMFDARALTWDERCTVEALQGLVNRGGPRLYLDYGFSWDGKWIDIYAERNGIKYQRHSGLRALLQRYGAAAKGLVVYDPGVDGCRYVAMTMAGVEDLLPVCPALLAGDSPNLRAANDWPGADFAQADEAYLNYWLRAAGPGLSLQPGEGLRMQEGNDQPGNDWSFISHGPVTVDLAKFPFLEVDIADLKGEDAGWAIKLTWDRDDSGYVGGGQDDLCLPRSSQTGVHRYDIAELAGLRTRHTFHKIQLHVAGPSAAVTWRRVRFVSADGDAPQSVPAQPLTDLGLPVKHDLRGKFESSVTAYEWALENLMPRCNRHLAHAVNGTVEGVKAGCGPFPGFDWPVMRKGFVFNLACPPDESESYGGSKVGGDPQQAAMYVKIMQALEPIAEITGYGEPEGYWCNLISEHGHYSFHFGDNWSFHSKVPTGKTSYKQKIGFTPQNVAPQQDKYYVCFMTSEGDTMKGPIPFFYNSWFEKERGKVPMNWGINPLMAEQFGAMLDYFYQTATDQDYFFVGCSGAGYVYPDRMPNLADFARHTRRACELAGTPCIDLWGAHKPEVLRQYVDIARPLGMSVNASPARLEMSVGNTPVAYHGLAYWQLSAPVEGHYTTAFEDDAKRAKAVRWLVERIEDIADRHYPPFIILVYADLHNYAHHCRLHREVARALDPSRFVPARLDEAMAAMRAWTTDHVVLGSTGLNERLSWATLKGVPTQMPLNVTNGRDSDAQIRATLSVAGKQFATRAMVAAGESKQLPGLLALVDDVPDQAALLTVSAEGPEQRRDVRMVAVPAPDDLNAADLVGVWNAADLRHAAGEMISDEAASWGKAWVSPDAGAKQCHIVFGPYAGLPAARYLVAFRLKLAEQPTAAGDEPIAALDMFTGGYEGLGESVAELKLTPEMFTRAGQWQWFTMQGQWPGTPSLLETRVWWHGNTKILVDRVAVFRLP